jgi:hypothetical protein
MSTIIPIDGNTYPVRDKLKAIGAKWDAVRKCWMISQSKAMEARRIVSTAPQTAKPAFTGKCLKCKGPVKEPYLVCYGCKHPDDASQRRAPRGNFAPGGATCPMCGSRECARAWDPRDLCDED